MLWRELIGSRLLKFSDDGFSVKTPKGEIRNFAFEEDVGGCCGYNDLETSLFISEEDIKRNPVITNIRREEIDEMCTEGMTAVITFFGEQKKMAKVSSFSSSGSGTSYGACVWVRCVETDEKELLSEW